MVNITKLSIEIVEHLVAKVIGTDAIQTIRQEVLQEVKKGLTQALHNTESRLTREPNGSELIVLFYDFPPSNQESIQIAVSEYYTNPNDTGLENLLVENIRSLAPKRIETEQIREFVKLYLDILRTELIAFSPNSTLAEKLASLSLQSIEAEVREIVPLLKEIHSTLQLMLQVPSLNLPVLRPEDGIKPRLGEFYMNQYDKLLGWLNLLTDLEFRALMRTSMTPTELNFLPRPVDIISRVDFLGDIQQRRRLDEVEKYLLEKYADLLR